MNFRVIQYELNGDNIEVFCVNGSKETHIVLDKEKFEFWLLCNNKLSWKISKTESEIHRIEEVEGFMSFEEYWQFDTIVLIDAKDYIKSNITNNYILNKLSKIQ